MRKPQITIILSLFVLLQLHAQTTAMLDMQTLKGKQLSEVFDLLTGRGFLSIAPVPVKSKLPKETVIGIKINGQNAESGKQYPTNSRIRVLVSMGTENLFNDEQPQIPEFDPHITTGPIRFTGMRFKDPDIHTGPIKFTGMRTGDLHIATGPIKFTGMRFHSLHITTGPVIFTGMRFKDPNIRTGSIKFTGMRELEEKALEWIGPQIEAVRTTFMDFINQAQAYQQEAAVEKLNTVVTLVDELKQQALISKQTEFQQLMETISGHLGELQTIYPTPMDNQEAVVIGTQTDAQKQQMEAVKTKSQQIMSTLSQTQNQLPEIMKAP